VVRTPPVETTPPPAPPLSHPDEPLIFPPLAPRDAPRDYLWRIILTDGFAIPAMVFSIVGSVFSVVGLFLTLSIVAAAVGLPFLFLGIIFLGIGGPLLVWRYNQAQAHALVYRLGTAVAGRIVDISENYMIYVNRRHPWTIEYRFNALGQEIESQVVTLRRPGPNLHPGQPIVVLYLPEDPRQNTIYPPL
jgi:hypothetical protein